MEKLNLKSRLVAFCKELNCVDGASRHWLKKCIHTRWLVDAKSKEERKRIFSGKSQGFIFPVLLSSSFYFPRSSFLKLLLTFIPFTLHMWLRMTTPYEIWWKRSERLLVWLELQTLLISEELLPWEHQMDTFSSVSGQVIHIAIPSSQLEVQNPAAQTAIGRLYSIPEVDEI